MRLLEIAVDLAPPTEEAALWDERLWNIGFVVLRRPRDGRPRDINREVYGDEVADAVAARDARLRREFADPSAIDRATGRPDDLRALELYRAHGARHLEPGVLLRLEQGAYFAGDPEATEAWAREALRSAEELGWRDVIGWATGDLLNALFAGPSPLSRLVTEAAALLDRWAGRLASRPVLMVRAQARALMGDALGARADLDESARLRDALGLPRDMDDLWAEPPMAQAAGDLRAAAEACREALAQHPDEDALNRNFLLGTYARVLLDLGLDEQAWAAIDPLETSRIIEQRITHRSIRAQAPRPREATSTRPSPRSTRRPLSRRRRAWRSSRPTWPSTVRTSCSPPAASSMRGPAPRTPWTATGRRSTRSARAKRWRCSVR